ELETAATGEAGDLSCEPYWGSATLIDRHPAATLRGLSAEMPNVLFLTADTLRADALGTWGREPTRSPALDRFAGTSDVWMNAYSSINNTNPSFASLMTGLYVKNHRIFNLTTPLPKTHTTLAEVLGKAGYATRAIVSAAHLGRSGLRQGFDEFTQPGGQFFAEAVVDMGIEWLQEGGDAPFFLWLHFFDVHTPHNPPAPYVRGVRPSTPAGMEPVATWEKFRSGGIPKRLPGKPHPFSGNSKLYASEVAYLDRQIDRLLSYIDSYGLSDRTIVVFVSDHGETLGERQSFYHHSGLYEETTHVPLMIRWPGQQKGRRVEGLVQHFDVFPTLLHAIGLPVPEQDGVDLRIGAEGGGTREIVFANHANNRGEMARTEEHLLLVNRKVKNLKDGPHFYKLGDDPKARKDLAAERLPEQAELRERLRSWRRDRRKLAPPVARKIDAAERAQLKALGYLE
ncbi:MAG: sulfatase, partial [Myxococcota bacterium]|nr:sulfatase [Myxococcota bacterium]